MGEFTNNYEKIREGFYDFVLEKIEPFSKSNDVNEKLDESVVESIKKEGYLGSMISKDYGGIGFDSISIGILNEEIGRACSSARSLLTVHGMVAIAIEKWGTDTQRNFWLKRLAEGEEIGAFALTESEAGSDANSLKTTSVLNGDNYIINGAKKWITMGQIATVFLVFAKLNGKATAFLVPAHAPGVSITPIKNLMGVRGSMLAEISFDNCIISKGNLVGGEGFGLSHIGLFSLDYGRYTIACGCVGLAQACLSECLKYVREREQFKVPIGEHQLIQKMITEMVVNIKSARLLCYNAGKLREEGNPDSIMETWCAKYQASKVANKVAYNAVQIFGAKGLVNDYKIERYYRDARVNEIIEGSSQIHECLIAKNIINNYR